MIFVTLSSYIGGLLIDLFRSNEQYRSLTKGAAIICLLCIVGLLLYFKYANFLLNSLNHVSAAIRGEGVFELIDVILPVGISFFTFQAMGYVIDVYRGDSPPEKHLGIYALYVSFFPQLVAGPIERSFNLIRQFKERSLFNYDLARKGALQILWGFFLKVVVADRVAVVANQVYNNPENYEGWVLITGTVFFSMQIFGDFAGYSYIAIGSAKLFGVNLMKNFNNPYFATSIGGFWRRWHISLSTWFKDYLFIPIGGSRVKLWLTYRNILIVFVVSGLWHGANWTFAIWGTLHGLYWVFENVFLKVKLKLVDKYSISFNSSKLLGFVFTYLAVCFAWIFFRANSLEDALLIISNLQYLDAAQLFNGYLYKLGLDEREFNIALVGIALMLTLEYLNTRFDIHKWLIGQWLIIRWSIYLVMLMLILLYGYFNMGDSTPDFIYFQF